MWRDVPTVVYIYICSYIHILYIKKEPVIHSMICKHITIEQPFNSQVPLLVCSAATFRCPQHILL